MKTKKYQRRKRVLTIVAIVIAAAMIFTYVLQITAFGLSNTPPPEQPGGGTDLGFDDSTLPAPWEDEDEEELAPVLRILDVNITLNVDQKFQISFIIENFPAGTVLEWRTNNPDVAIVTAEGVVMAVGTGDAEITVIAGDKRSSVLVIVKNLLATGIEIEIIDSEGLAKETGRKQYELVVGDVIRLRSKITPDGAKVQKITWAVGNDEVASIPQAERNGQECTFTARAIGSTTVTVTADGFTDKITINIEESGMSTDTIFDYIRYAVIIIIAAVGAAVFLTWLAQKRKKEKLRAKAMARRRREEAEKRAREEAGRKGQNRENMNRNTRQTQAEGRETFKSKGALVGAGVSAPPGGRGPDQERPVTLDDLD